MAKMHSEKNGGGEMKAKTFSILIIIVAFMIAAPVLIAHHSFAAAYDLNKTITVKGTLTRVDWANPHISFFLDVADKAGKVTKWGVDAAAPAALAARGLNRAALKPGDTITVEAYPARNGMP